MTSNVIVVNLVRRRPYKDRLTDKATTLLVDLSKQVNRRSQANPTGKSCTSGQSQVGLLQYQSQSQVGLLQYQSQIATVPGGPRRVFTTRYILNINFI